jgi:hypothetical protein
MTTLDDFLMVLRVEAQRIDQLSPNAVWYLFGSTLESFQNAANIDLLILCADDDVASLVRHELQDTCLSFPLHLFLLTRQEEAELNFIAQEHCMKVYPSLQ